MKLWPFSIIAFFLFFACGNTEELRKRSEICASENKNIDSPYCCPNCIRPSSLPQSPVGTPCKTPRVGRRLDGSNFKYGCFCGANHPKIDRSEVTSPPSNAIAVERISRRILSVRPVDKLDSFCQRHDLCLLEFGYDGRCHFTFFVQMYNYILPYRLDPYSGEFVVKDFIRERYGDLSESEYAAKLHTGAPGRCRQLAGDMAEMVNLWGTTTHNKHQNILTKTISLIFFSVLEVVTIPPIISYPLPGERCN